MNEPTASSNSCPKCGAVLPSTATAGLCPRCLLAEAMVPTQVDAEPAAQPPLPPEQIAPHFPQLEIMECLGRGGMGVVYKARQITLNRIVALKLLAPERVRDPQFAERFTREAQALAALNHSNIVTIYDFGQAGGFYYLLMEFVDGVNLRQLLRTRKFTPEEALAIVPPLCDALQFAHDRSIVHRDIKPENLLLDKAGRVKVADFGIAKMLGTVHAGSHAGASVVPENATETAVGTPGYSAPEQKTDPQRVDSRADIYSLGVVFYEMLTGELPGKRIEPPSRKVQIDVRLDEIVLRALEKKPELRYQQVNDVKTCVETIVRSAATASTGTAGKAFDGAADGARGRALSEPRFSKVKMAIVIGVAVALAAVTAIVVVKATFFPAPPDSYFQANYQHFQSLPSGLFVFRPTHFHTPLNGLDYSAEAQSPSGEHLTWMMGRNRTFVQFVTRLYNCESNQVIWPADLPEGRFDYLYTMLDSKTGERFGVALRKELGLELVPTNLPGEVLVVEKMAASKGTASEPPSAEQTTLAQVPVGHVDARLGSKVKYTSEQASVQDIVQSLAAQVGLRYDWQKSHDQTDPLCRQWVRNVVIEGQTCNEALEQVLKPVGLRYQLAEGVLVLSRQVEGTQPPKSGASSNSLPVGKGYVTSLLPAGPVELKLKWPRVGERFVFDVDMKRNGEYLKPGQPDPLKEDLTVNKKYGLTVLSADPGGGHLVELEFLSYRDRIVLGGKRVLDYDSTDTSLSHGSNALARLFGKVAGFKIRCFLDASNEVGRMEGVDELEQRLSSTDASAFSKIQFGASFLKLMINGLHEYLPPKPVLPGDTWPFQTEVALSPLGTMTMDSVVTFQNWEQHWKRNCARLEYKSTLNTKPDPGPNPAGISVSSFEGTISGVAWFDPELGMIIETTANSDMKMVLNHMPGDPGANPGASGTAPGTVYQWHDVVNSTLLQHYVLEALGAPVSGIGIQLRADGGHIIVQEIIPGTPAAAQKDIHAGDRIIAVAPDTGPAVPVQDGNIAHAAALIQGLAGTTVRLTLVSAGDDDSHARVVSVVRAELKLPPH
ncbi:MAG: protein kinase [Verrucomicrobiae bacterium]|nr:protein kinase [Verrucomicrobiae bacterium]